MKKHEKTHRSHEDGDVPKVKVGRKAISRPGRLKKKKILKNESNFTSTNESQGPNPNLSSNENLPNTTSQGLQAVYSFGSSGVNVLPSAPVSTTGIVPRRGRPPKKKNISLLKPAVPMQHPVEEQKSDMETNVKFSQAIDNLINSVVGDCTGINEDPFNTLENTLSQTDDYKLTELSSPHISSGFIKTEEEEQKQENHSILINSIEQDGQSADISYRQLHDSQFTTTSSGFNTSIMFPSSLMMYNNEPGSQILDYQNFVNNAFTSQDIK